MGQRFFNAVLQHRGGDEFGGLPGWLGAAAQAGAVGSKAEHGNVIGAVADGAGVLRGSAQMLQDTLHAGSLGKALQHQLIHAVHGLAGSQSAGIIGEAQTVSSIGGSGQSSTVDPGKVPAGAIVVAGGIANGIVGNRLPVKTGEQILPVGITVGVAVGGSAIGGGQNIARTIVGKV